MAYQFIPYQQSASFKWKWPLEIGVIDQTDQQREFIIDNQWSHKFCHIHNINDTKQAFNIIYHEGDLTDIYQAISKDNAFASLVILRVEESFFLDSFDENEVKRKLKFIAIIAKAHAVLVITFSFSVNDWLNLFTVELCHNKTIRASLEKTCSHVFGLYNDELDQKATLSYIFEKVINILRLNVEKYPKKYIFKSHFILQDPITIDDLQDLLVDRKQRAQYNHESDEATGLAEIIKSINENTGMNILDEQEIMQYAKPPISSIPLDRGGKPPKNSIPPPFDYGVGGTEIKKDDSFWMKVKDVFKLKGRGTSVPGPDKPKPIPVKIEPRYLQSFFRDTSNENIESLFVSTPYKVIVQIGEFNRKLTQDTNHPIPTDKIFTDPKSDKETIQIQFHSNLSKTIQSSNITLSRIGDSDEAEFNIVTSDHAMMFEAEIYAYHKNRLIQKAILTAHILEANANPDKFPSPQLSIDLKLVSDLENLNQHQPFYTSIGGQLSNKIDEPIPGISNQSPLDLNFSSALQTLMLTIKNRIQQAAIDTKEYPEDLYAENNQTLLLQLALDGNDLFVNHLKQFKKFDGPIQIISYKDEFIPLDFVYTFATPNIDAQVCKHASEALLKGKCCGCKEINETPCSLVCPFGFLGLSHVIEHHSIEKYKSKKSDGEYQVLAEPGNQREPLSILKNTLYATSNKVVKANPNLADEIKSAFKKNTKHSIAASSWNDWTSKIETENPDSLILIVHIEKEERSDRFQLEIGKEDFKIKNLINRSQISSKNAKQPPFIVLIGCEAVELDYYGFDISSQLMNYGAAIVISNFTKIRGRHAGPIVMKLLEFLKAHEDREFTLGEIVLKLRQYLLAKGIMVGFSLTTLGDADWKIKIA